MSHSRPVSSLTEPPSTLTEANRHTWEYAPVEEHDLAERDPLALCPTLPLVHPRPQLLQHRVAYHPHTPRHQHSKSRHEVM